MKLLFLIVLLITTPALAQIFEYLDSKGNHYFSNRVPCLGKDLQLQPVKKNSAHASSLPVITDRSVNVPENIQEKKSKS